ncbi:hypothetical protein U1Q18_009375 [Sarracenia purpurea var. burkii]
MFGTWGVVSADFGQILRWLLQIWGVVRYAVMNGSAAMTFVMCCHECWFLTDMGDAMALLCCYDLWLVLIGDATAYEWEYCC